MKKKTLSTHLLRLRKELDVPVYIAESPLTCVAEGTGVLLNNLYLIEK